MKALQQFKKWIVGGCIWYAILNVGFLLIWALFFFDAEKNVGPSLGAFALLIPAALTISLATRLYQTEQIPRWARILLHYLLTVLAVFLFLYLPADAKKSPSSGLVMFALFTAVYWVLFVAVTLLAGAWKKRISDGK